MAVIETWLEQDLQAPVKVRYLDGSLFSNNGNGNRIGVRVYNNGEPVTLSGTVSGYVVVADGSTVPCTGSRSGNQASILIPPAAYQPGAVFISVFLTDGSAVTTLAAVSSTVMQTRTNSQVSPGSVVQDWTQTINAAMQSVVDANAANMAQTYGELSFPVPMGKYTLYNDLLYRCITPIATSESWTASHWKRVKLADDVADLKNKLNEIMPVVEASWTDGFYIKTSGDIGTVVDISNPISSSTNGYAIEDCQEGDVVILTGSSGNNSRGLCFIDSANKILFRTGAQVTFTDAEYIAPAGTAKAVLNLFNTSTRYAYIGYSVKKNVDLLTDYTEKASLLERDITPVPVKFYGNMYINLGGGVGAQASLTPVVSNNYKYAIVDCEAGDIAIITGQGGENARAFAFLDENNYILKVAMANAQYSNVTTDAPYGTKKVVLNLYNAENNFAYVGHSIIEDLQKQSDFTVNAIEAVTGNTVYQYIRDHTAFDLSGTVATRIAEGNTPIYYAIVPCAEDDVFTISCTGGSGARAYAFVDASYNILTVSAANINITDRVITAPENAAYLISNSVGANAQRKIVKGRTVYNRIDSFTRQGWFYGAGINIDTVNNTVFISAQRIKYGNNEADMPSSQTVSVDPSVSYIRLIYNSETKLFRTIAGTSAVTTEDDYLFGLWYKFAVRNATINGGFTVDGANPEPTSRMALNHNMVGPYDMCWEYHNWTHPEVVSINGIRNRLYFDFVTSYGMSGIAAYDFDTKLITKTILKNNVTPDDHNTIAILPLSDNRLLCAYSEGHGGVNRLYVRKSLTPENIDRFDGARRLTSSGNTTYSQLLEYNGRIFLFYRVAAVSWGYRYSDDEGETWSEETILVTDAEQMYTQITETTTPGVVRLLLYRNAAFSDTSIHMGFLHLDSLTVYNADNSTILGESEIDLDSFTTMVSNPSGGKHNRMFMAAVTATTRALFLYNVFTSTSGANDGAYYVYDNGTSVKICDSGAPHWQPTRTGGADWIGTEQIVIGRENNGIDYIELYNYSNGVVELDKEITHKPTTGSIRTILPKVDINGKAIVYVHGYYTAYTDFNTDSRVYELN